MPKKVRKKSAFTNKSAKKSAFTNKSAQKSTFKSTFGSSAPICSRTHDARHRQFIINGLHRLEGVSLAVDGAEISEYDLNMEKKPPIDIISLYSSLDLLSFSLCNKLFEKEIPWLTHNWRFDLFVVFLPVMDKL